MLSGMSTPCNKGNREPPLSPLNLELACDHALKYQKKLERCYETLELSLARGVLMCL